jgi:NlpC/P60 family putative phage cell wall peptidase
MSAAVAPAAVPALVPAAAVVAEARTWLGTRWQHQASLKGTACDCAGLVLGVARALGLPVPAAVPAYDRRPDGVLLRELCEAYLCPLPHAPALREAVVAFAPEQVARYCAEPVPAPGHVLLFRFDSAPQHLGIVGNGPGYLTLIHAHAPDRRVVEHRLDATWRARLVAAYALPGVAAWPV